MKLRNRYRMPLTAAAMAVLVMLLLYPLSIMFTNALPPRPADNYDNYQGQVTHCSTFNHYWDKQAKTTTSKLLDYANNNAMTYLLWRFGKDQGRLMVSVCEQAQQRYIAQQCQQHLEKSLEQLILDFNRQAVEDTGAI